MGQLSSLINFAVSPIGLVVILLGILMLGKARSNRWLPWFALSGLIFAASLNRFISFWYPDPPRFFGMIDTLVGNGRPLTILLLGLLVVLPVRYTRASAKLPLFAIYFLTGNMVIALKIFFGGSMAFAVLSMVTTGLIFFLCSQVYRRWIQTEADIDAAIVAIAIAATMFVFLNAVQYVLGPNALAVANGRFNGTTGNPQHAAAFLGVGIPALVYFVLTRKTMLRFAAVAVVAIGTYFLLWTGSRTGLLMASAATLLLLRRSGPAAIGGTVLVVICGLYLLLTREFSDFALDRLSSLENTRSVVWSALWRQFTENPFIGVAVSGDRLGFGENSWLAMGATAGMLGLVPLLIAGFFLFLLAFQLLTKRSSYRTAQLQGDFLGGAIVSLLIGSIFEAYLLAVVSSATFTLLLVGTVGVRRLEINAKIRVMQQQVPLREGVPLSFTNAGTNPRPFR